MEAKLNETKAVEEGNQLQLGDLVYSKEYNSWEIVCFNFERKLYYLIDLDGKSHFYGTDHIETLAKLTNRVNRDTEKWGFKHYPQSKYQILVTPKDSFMCE